MTDELAEMKALMKEAERLALELDDARNATPKSPMMTGLPRGGSQTTLDLQMEVIENAQKRFDKARERALNKLNEIEDRIDALEEYQFQQVLYFRHIYRMKWLDVAERMHYCERTVRRIHKKALKALEVNEC